MAKGYSEVAKGISNPSEELISIEDFIKLVEGDEEG
jgi:hypothetical protein